jgi:hypothetical protein
MNPARKSCRIPTGFGNFAQAKRRSVHFQRGISLLSSHRWRCPCHWTVKMVVTGGDVARDKKEVS